MVSFRHIRVNTLHTDDDDDDDDDDNDDRYIRVELTRIFGKRLLSIQCMFSFSL